MDHHIELFINDYLKEVREHNAAVFAGAGLSVPAGYVNWRELLRPLAKELRLDLDKENDLVAVAQYHCNENGGNRHILNQLLLDKFTVAAKPTDNHRILARLPVTTYWTTNYDQLIETALKEVGKIPDVKYTTQHLATTIARRDATVYKMHGDVAHPNEAVLIKDDYEKYHLTRGPFISALSGDLVSKTFLFLGFSFTDPNLDYVLSRVRVTFQKDQRRHYCVFKKRVRESEESEDEFKQAKVKQELAIKDLNRFNIKTILIDSYSQITEILSRIERHYRQRTIFVSGSAEEYAGWTKEGTEEFLRDLSNSLVHRCHRLVSGIGLGVGDAIITGALEEIYRGRTGHIEDSLIMRPFPRASPDKNAREKLWEEYRQELISTAGICLVVFGNKRVDGKIVLAQGVLREVEIARQRGLQIVPIGATGYVAKETWKNMSARFEDYFPEGKAEIRNKFAKLGDEVEKPSELVSRTVEFIEAIIKE